MKKGKVFLVVFFLASLKKNYLEQRKKNTDIVSFFSEAKKKEPGRTKNLPSKLTKIYYFLSVRRKIMTKHKNRAFLCLVRLFH